MARKVVNRRELREQSDAAEARGTASLAPASAETQAASDLEASAQGEADTAEAREATRESELRSG